MKLTLILTILFAFVHGTCTEAVAGDAPLFAGLSYSPSGSDSLLPNVYVSESRIRTDLELLATVTHRIRTYTVENGMDRVPAVARALGMKVSLGIWLGSDRTTNDEEVAKALSIIVTNADVIDRVFVGNETLLRGDLSLAELAGYLRDVKAGTRGLNIEVTTGETWSFWLKYPELAQDCDVIGVHIIPYWDAYPLEGAMNDIMERFSQMQQTFPGKKIIIAETGWPSRGAVRGGAIPSSAGQAHFIQEFLRSAKINRFDYYIVEAFDQPWKAFSREGEVGAAWGVFDAQKLPKLDFAALLSVENK